jgi:hypothetical protein
MQARMVRLTKAAGKVQRVYRGHLVRNDVNDTIHQLLYGHMTSSVTLVANNYRMHAAQRRQREMVQSAGATNLGQMSRQLDPATRRWHGL